MIPVTPYFAEYRVAVEKTDGKLEREWHSCKVIGVIKPDGHDPEYLIEIYHSGTSSLTTTDEVKRLARAQRGREETSRFLALIGELKHGLGCDWGRMSFCQQRAACYDAVCAGSKRC
ncbi:Hypothetical protein NGAL_HAMBI2605_09620 [Neorhizobium galegae bv. orientalis]|nr:Hypothetical protein NGAL_HAMBI2605_09620 [Neorhizobium galegae bv. orientalis]